VPQPTSRSRAALVIAAFAFVAGCTSAGHEANDPTATEVTQFATPTTTPGAAPAPLSLRVDGVGPYRFSMPIDQVLDGLAAQLGSPATDLPRDYRTDDGFGGFQTADGEFGYVERHGRETCWTFGFCAEFGGPTLDRLTFTGWTYGGDTAGRLSTEDLVTIGTRWSAAPSLVVNPGGCYAQGTGSTGAGIALTLESSGTPFSEFDAAGNYLEHLPDQSDVTVVSMQTGDVPVFLFADC
jgi:hypothetical protein